MDHRSPLAKLATQRGIGACAGSAVALCLWGTPRTVAADPSDGVKLGSSCSVDPDTHMLPAADVINPAPSAEHPQDDPIPAPAVLFLNFDGATIEYGPDDAPNNVAWQWSGQYPAYGTGPDRTAAVNAVKANYADFNLLVTDARPASGDYSMIMVGPGMGGGVATLDCNNTSNRNVGFAGHAANDGWGAGTHAALISHEAGHTFGMDHIGNADNIMNPTVYDGARFARSCVDLAGSGCSHDCGSAQNTYDELMAIFGPAAPDEAPPTVAIISPADTDSLGVGIITIVADAADDIGVGEVTLVIDGMSISTRTSEPWSWEAEFNEPGMFTLEAIARDDWGNETTSNPVTITVADGGGSGGSGSGSGSGGSGSGGSGSSGGDDGTEGGTDDGYDDGGSGLPPGFGLDEDDRGCGCVTGSRRAPPRWLALVAFGMVLRRRRWAGGRGPQSSDPIDGQFGMGAAGGLTSRSRLCLCYDRRRDRSHGHRFEEASDRGAAGGSGGAAAGAESAARAPGGLGRGD